MTTPYHCEENVIHEDLVNAARKNLLDGASAATLAATFQALADPTRLRLISAMAENELCVCDLAALTSMTQSAISHQLRLLRNLRLVQSRKEGRIVFYTLHDAHIAALFRMGLEHIQHTDQL